jgi:hypothetical protein
MITKFVKFLQTLLQETSTSKDLTESQEINDSKNTDALKKENDLNWLKHKPRGHTTERLAEFEKDYVFMDNEVRLLDKNTLYDIWLGGKRTAENKKELEAKYGDKEIAERIIKKELWIGMSKDMLLDVKGRPEHKSEKVTSNKKKEEYYYEGYKNIRGNPSYKFKVVLVDGFVSGWNDNDV